MKSKGETAGFTPASTKFPFSISPFEFMSGGGPFKDGTPSGKADKALLEFDEAKRRLFDAYQGVYAVVHGMRDATTLAAVKSGATFTCDEIEEIEDAYRKNGFRSKKVKAAVKKVRAMAFDDSLAEFKEIACADVLSEAKGLEFRFEHLLSGKNFGVVVPEVDLGEDGMPALSPLHFGGRYYDSFNVDGCLEAASEAVVGFALVHPYDHSDTVTVAFDYDAGRFKKSVIEYVMAGFEPVRRLEDGSPFASRYKVWRSNFAMPRWETCEDYHYWRFDNRTAYSLDDSGEIKVTLEKKEEEAS